MKYTDLDKYITEHNLLKDIQDKPGIYGIIVDNIVVYVGQSENVRRRCKQHIYNTQNAMLINEPKYNLLLSAQLGGHRVDCIVLEYCQVANLLATETLYISLCHPLLNIQKNKGIDNLNNVKIDDIIKLIDKNKAFFQEAANEEKSI